VNAPAILRAGTATRGRAATRGATRRGEASPAGRSRWLVTLLFLGLLAATIDLGWRAFREVANVPISQVQVNGDFRFLDKARVEEIMLPHLGTGYFMVDLPRMRDELARLPLVHEVTVRRAWPDRLLVFITEQVPVLRFGDDAYLNPYAEVFRPGAPLANVDLPVVRGPERSARLLLERFDRLTGMLEPTGLRITELALDGKHAWRLGLSNGAEVLLGRRDMDHKMKLLTQLLTDTWATERDRILRLDMRYSNGVAVAWRDGVAPPARAPAARKET
jgi:cell division protein FtsQ